MQKEDKDIQKDQEQEQEYIIDIGDRQYKPSKKYIKITSDVKKTLLNSIIQDHMSIKQAAESLDMNYTSAKQILADHRKQIKTVPIKTKKIKKSYIRAEIEDKEAHYNNNPHNGHQSVHLICSIGGKSEEFKGNNSNSTKSQDSLFGKKQKEAQMS